jgi:hypothetical protein
MKCPKFVPEIARLNEVCNMGFFSTKEIAFDEIKKAIDKKIDESEES